MSRIQTAIAILETRLDIARGYRADRVRPASRNAKGRHYSRIMRAYRRTVALAMGIGSVSS